VPVPTRIRRANSGRRAPFLAGPKCFPGRSGRRFPGRPEQERRSGHRPAFPDTLGSLGWLALAASSTHSDSTGSGSTGSGSTGSGSTGSGSTGSGSTGSGSTGSGLTGSDPMAWGPAGSGGAGADADGSGPTDSHKVGPDGDLSSSADGDLSSSARRWNAAAALAVLPYSRLSFRACRCASPHSRCLSCSRRNCSASAEQLRRLVVSRIVASSALENNPICPTHRLFRNTDPPRHYSITRTPRSRNKNPAPRGHPHHRKTPGKQFRTLRHVAIPATGPVSASAADRSLRSAIWGVPRNSIPSGDPRTPWSCRGG